MLPASYEIVDGNGNRVGSMTYFKVAVAKSVAKRTAIARWRKTRSSTDSHLRILKIKDIAENIWSAQERISEYFGEDLHNAIMNKRAA